MHLHIKNFILSNLNSRNFKNLNLNIIFLLLFFLENILKMEVKIE